MYFLSDFIALYCYANFWTFYMNIQIDYYKKKMNSPIFNKDFEFDHVYVSQNKRLQWRLDFNFAILT